MMQPRIMRDSRGQPSWTLTMVVPGFFALTTKFLVGGLTFPVVGLIPLMSGLDYAAAAAAILGVWVTREYNDKKLEAVAAANGKTFPQGGAIPDGIKPV